MTAQYFFGPFRYDARAARLSRAGVDIALGHRGTLILGALLAARGRIVSKRELIDAAWGGAAIEESNLSVQVSKLRRTIGDDRIRTIERVGYQFVGADQNAMSLSSSGLANAFPTVALVSAGGDDALQLLSALAATLARFKTIRVTVAPGDDDADYVATLSRPRDGASNAMVRLADGPSGIVLWAQRFEKLDEWLAEQIASAIESEVRTAEYLHGGRRNAPGAEAYTLYLRGRHALSSSREIDNRTAFGLFTAAVDLEPENPAYLAAATEAMHHRLSVGWESLGPDDKRICRELAFRTLAVAGNDAVAIALAGNGLFTADEEDMGLALCRRAFAMNPTSQLVLACTLHAERWGGSMEESETASRMAVALAPNDPAQRFALGGLATIATWRGDFAAALDLGRQALAFGPGYIGGHHSVIEALIGLGRQEDAERQMARYMTVASGVTIDRLVRGQHIADPSRLAARVDSLRRAGLPER